MAGGGPAGALAGLVLARLGWDVRLVDAGGGMGAKPGEVLAEAGARLLRAIGLAPVLTRPAHAPCAGIVQLERSGGVVRGPWSGVILDRACFEDDLLAACRGAGCGVVRPARIGRVERAADGGVWLQVDAPPARLEYRARLAIDASGRGARLACGLGARRRVVTNLAASWGMLASGCMPWPPGTLALGTADNAWWYAAVGRERTALAILSRRPPKDGPQWLRALAATHVFGDPARHAEVVSDPCVRPAGIGLLSAAHGEGWLAAGDAAASFDPLSGFGLTFALASGYYAARAADDTLRGDDAAPDIYAALIHERCREAWNRLGAAYARFVGDADSRSRTARRVHAAPPERLDRVQ